MLKRFPVVALVSTLALTLPGCGRTELESGGAGQSGGAGGPGRPDGGLDAPTDRGAGGSGGGILGGGGRGGSTGGVSGTGGRPGIGGRTGTGGRIGTGGVPGVDGGTARDGGTDVLPDGGVVRPPMPGVLVCGTQTCNMATQSCCVGFAAGSVGARCIPAGTACPGAALACDEPADCVAGICCFGLQTGGPGGATLGSRCVARAACGGIGRFVVCRANSDCGAPTPVCCTGLAVPICQIRCPGA